jgi:hypothetical protein
MPRETREEFPHNSLRRTWPPPSTRTRKCIEILRQNENLSYLDYRKNEATGENEDSDDSSDDEDEPRDNISGENENKSGDEDSHANNPNISIRTFMGALAGEEPLLCRHQDRQVTQFCEQSNDKQEGTTEDPKTKGVALLDDRSIGDAVFPKQGRCRPYTGILTPQQLAKELGKKVRWSNSYQY